jgi:hypothetical protein
MFEAVGWCGRCERPILLVSERQGSSAHESVFCECLPAPTTAKCEYLSHFDIVKMSAILPRWTAVQPGFYVHLADAFDPLDGAWIWFNEDREAAMKWVDKLNGTTSLFECDLREFSGEHRIP